MYFTREDFIKIHNWLKVNSVKDTDFIPADIPLHKGDTVAIVQDDINKQLPLKYLMKVFTLLTQDEFDALLLSGQLDEDMIYGILSEQGDLVDQIYFGHIPFAINGARTVFEYADDWVITENINEVTNNISCLGDTVTAQYKAERVVHYSWTDGRPETSKIEKGIIQFDISPYESIISVSINSQQPDYFNFKIQPNIGARNSQRNIPVKVSVYSNITKDTYTIPNHSQYIFNQNFASLNIPATASKSAEEGDLKLTITVGSTNGDLHINRDNISLSNDSIVQIVDLVPITTSSYELTLHFEENTTLDIRKVICTVSSGIEGLNAVCTITQAIRNTITVSGILFTGMTAYTDNSYQTPVETPISANYNGSVTLYLKADEGYHLPANQSDFLIEPEGINASYRRDNNLTTGVLTLSNLKQDVTSIEADALEIVNYTYDSPVIVLSYVNEVDGENSQPNNPTSPTEFSWSVNKTYYYKDGSYSSKQKTVGQDITDAIVKFTMVAKDSNGNVINEELHPTGTIDTNSGDILWLINDTAKNKKVQVTVSVTVKDKNSTGEHTNTKTVEIVQKYPTRTIKIASAINVVGCTLKLISGKTKVNQLTIPYGGSAQVSLELTQGYELPTESNYRSKFNITPLAGFGDLEYTIEDSDTASLIIKDIMFTSTSNTMTVGCKCTEIVLEQSHVYVGEINTNVSGFSTIMPLTSITTAMYQQAIDNGDIQMINDARLPIQEDASEALEVSTTTRRSYFIGLVPETGTNSKYVIKFYNGVTGSFEPFNYTAASKGYHSNGEVKVTIDGIQYKVFAMCYAFPVTIKISIA